MNSKQQKYLDSVPVMFKGVLERALDGKANPRAAIKAKCLDCTCFSREEITLCTVQLCPLYPLRPYQKKAQKSLREGVSGQEEIL